MPWFIQDVTQDLSYEDAWPDVSWGSEVTLVRRRIAWTMRAEASLDGWDLAVNHRRTVLGATPM